jgi:hypothetical protein
LFSCSTTNDFEAEFSSAILHDGEVNCGS